MYNYLTKIFLHKMLLLLAFKNLNIVFKPIPIYIPDQSKFDENNRLKVNDFLQIEGLEGVFALGDCCNKTSTAGAAYAGLHAQCIASNVIREIKGQSPQGFKPSE